MPTVKRNPQDPRAVRLTMLRESFGMNARQFSEYIGVDYQRWHNYERGLPLNVEIALQLCAKIPGLTLDWLYRGNVEGLPVALASRLGVLHTPVARKV